MTANTPSTMQKTTKDIAVAALATAAGSATGTASSAAIMHHIDTSKAAEVDAVVVTDSAAAEAAAADAAEIERVETIQEHADTASAQFAASAELIDDDGDRFAANEELIDTSSIEVSPDDDMSVHVIGVEAVENEQGGVAIVATLASGDETAIMADLDSDGIVDVLVLDINGDGVITEDEILDASEGNFHTDDIIAAYEAEHFADQVISDGPDYMNDADTAFYDA